MKTIEEQAREIAKEFGYDSYFGHGEHLSKAVKKGVKIAQRWIPVEEELPMSYESSTQWDGLRSEEITFEDKNGRKYYGRLYSGTLDGNLFNDFADNDGYTVDNVVKWRPIEYK